MKRAILVTASAFVLFAVTALTAPLAVAQSQVEQLTDEQRARIVTNCTSMKNTLNQLKASDALLRVNRGQTYESLSNRLMGSFNARLSNNSLDAKGMLSVTKSYNVTLNTFRTAYTAYERQLVATIRIDCTKYPDEFHAATQDARTKRAAVHDQVTALHQQIDSYRTVVNDFYQDYKRISGSN